MALYKDVLLTPFLLLRPIPQEAFDWYDEYAHGFSMSVLTASLMPNYAEAEQVSFNDPDIRARYEKFPSPSGHGEGQGYLVIPSKVKGPAPMVLVVHENRGLNPYIKDVARRLAKAGFIAFAPDALYPLGGYPGNDDEGRSMQRSLDRAKIEEDFINAARLRKRTQGKRCRLRCLYVRRSQPRVPQRLYRAVRPRGGGTSLVAHARVLQKAPLNPGSPIRIKRPLSN